VEAGHVDVTSTHGFIVKNALEEFDKDEKKLMIMTTRRNNATLEIMLLNSQ
jgi:hypothetical protein